MNKPPAFQLYVNDWLTDEKILAMTLEQEGAFIRLLCHQWKSNDCTLPNNDATLAYMARMTIERWREIGGLVRERFLPFGPQAPACQHPRISNLKLRSIWAVRMEFIRVQREKGAKGGRSKKLQPSPGLADAQAPAKPRLESGLTRMQALQSSVFCLPSSDCGLPTAEQQQPPPAEAGGASDPKPKSKPPPDNSPEAALAVLYRQIVKGTKGDCFAAKDTFRAALLSTPFAALEAAIRDGANAGKKGWQIVAAAEKATGRNATVSGRGTVSDKYKEIDNEPAIQV